MLYFKMFRRITITTISKGNHFVSSGRCKQMTASCLKFKIALQCSDTLNFTQARLCSSSSSGSTLHKVFFVHAESPPSSEGISDTASVEYIPPPPLPPEVTEESLNVLNQLGESTFQSLGLGGWTPIGLLQNCLEFLHVSGGLPWWGSIAVVTVIMRLCLSPLVVVSQRNAAKMNNHMPAIQRLQLKMTAARNSGNHLEAARLGYELQQLMVKSDIRPFRSMMVPLAQAPIFISMFIGLRRCANLPVESMKDGGLLWFTDLTIADPMWGLPLVTTLTMLATIEIGADGQQISSTNVKAIRYFLRALPFVILPFTIQFPAAILCYWVTTNLCSLVQVGVLKIPKVRNYFGISTLIQHNPDALPANKKGVVAGFKESWSNMKLSSEIDERQKVDEIRFKRAGTGPLVKTFKQNPLNKSAINVKAKARDP